VLSWAFAKEDNAGNCCKIAFHSKSRIAGPKRGLNVRGEVRAFLRSTQEPLFATWEPIMIIEARTAVAHVALDHLDRGEHRSHCPSTPGYVSPLSLFLGTASALGNAAAGLN